MRVIHVTNIPTPYRVTIGNEIWRLLRSRHDDYILLFQAQTSRRRKWQNLLDTAEFQYQFIRSLTLALSHEKSWLFSWGLWPALRRLQPEVIVVAGMGIEALICMLYSKVYRIPLAIHSGAIQTSPTDPFQEESGLGRYFRTLIRRKVFFPRVAAWIAYGTKARDYLKSERVPALKVFISQNTVDIKPFLALPRKQCPATGVKPFQVLYAGLLNKRKGFDLLVQVARQVKSNTIFHVVGGEASAFEEVCGHLRMPENMIFHGYVQPQCLPRYYQLADCFLFPTRADVFGLVAVEAAAAGLPIIISKFAGGAPDVVKSEVNGYIVDPENIKEMAAHIDHLATHPEIALRFGRASRQIVQKKFQVSHSARGWVEAVAFACQARGKSAENVSPSAKTTSVELARPERAK